MEAVRIDKELNTVFCDTFSLPLFEQFRELPDWGMNNDDVYLQRYMAHFNIDDAGAIYSLTFEAPNFLAVRQWPLRTNVPNKLTCAIENVNVADREMTFSNPIGRTVHKKQGILHIAAGCLDDSRDVVNRFCFVTFDFNENRVTSSWVYNPEHADLETLIDDDEMEDYRVQRMDIDPSGNRVTLICEQDLTRETYSTHTRLSGTEVKSSTYTIYETGNMLVFSCDTNGKLLWKNAIRKKAEDRTKWVYSRLDSFRRLIYFNNENDGYLKTTFNIETGEFSAPSHLMDIDSDIWMNILSMLWLDSDTALLLASEGTDPEDQHIMKLSGF
jgi:hypothetical protein